MMGKCIPSWKENETPYYHFTSLETLYKILASGKIRLTACNNSKNISVEIMALEAVINSCSKEEKENLCEQLSCGDDELIQKFIECREKSYMLCFTTDKNSNCGVNNDYLWKYYADHGKGVAIEFDYKTFPYKMHGLSKTRPNENSILQRDSRFRIFRMLYDEKRFKKRIREWAEMHDLFTDSYKPNFCSFEEEIRFIVFLNEISDHRKLEHTDDYDDIRRITVQEYNTDNRPIYLYYDVVSENNKSAIKKVFCRDKDTYKKLQKIFKDKGLYELLKA